MPRQPEALDEAVALALSWEHVQGVREVQRAAKGASGKCGLCSKGGHEEAQCKVQRRVRELWVRSNNSMRGCAITAGKDGEEVPEEGSGSTRLARLGSAVR